MRSWRVIALKKHKEHDSCQEKFQCEECETVFKENGKLEAHVKRDHTRFECDECDKNLDYEGILERHVESVHEDVELYCNYFNNNKDFSFGDQCIFLHNIKIASMGRLVSLLRLCTNSDGDDDCDYTDDEKEEEDEEDAEELKQKLEQVRKSVKKSCSFTRPGQPNL